MFKKLKKSDVEITEALNEAEENTTEAVEKKKKPKKVKLIKNQALFKRGGFAVGITACFLAGLILFNWLIAVLSDRFNLEYDMTTQKINTMSEENIDYIKGIEKDVTVTVCASEDDYVGGYMAYYAQYLHNATGENAADYYKQTINIVKKYADYNKKIKVNFIDPQSTDFTAISTKYSTDNLSYGDIVVSAIVKNDKGEETERHKTIGFDDIYTLSDESGYAAMGYGSYTVSGNNIETALTSAVAYVASGVSKKVAFLSGHSPYDYTASYTEILKNNNYEVNVISDKMITEISSDYDAVAIIAPNTDFIGSELNVISEFLDNNGQLGKGLIFFADASNPALPNLYDFIAQWGIKIEEGILFESNEQNFVSGDPTTMGVYPAEDDLTSDMTYCITGYNVPVTEIEPAETSITVTPLFKTLESVVKAPVGVEATWNGYTDNDKGTFYSVVQAEKTDYNDDNQEISSFVMVFSSVQFINSQWAEYAQLSNKNIALSATERAAGIEDMGISFISKTITNESFAQSVTAAGSRAVMIIFMIILPIVMLTLGIIIFIRRKNA